MTSVDAPEEFRWVSSGTTRDGGGQLTGCPEGSAAIGVQRATLGTTSGLLLRR
jgi:hypothetical protein